jgi:AcrR family transcriptional regulator
MPRVSDEHLAARRQQILDAAKVCFSRDGFHATSMQDVIAEAGLSVGAVYRYFKSKQELVTSIAEQVLVGADAVLSEIAAHEPPLPLADAVERALDFVDRQTGPDGIFRIAIQVWGEALRDPELAVPVQPLPAALRGHREAGAGGGRVATRRRRGSRRGGALRHGAGVRPPAHPRGRPG